MRSAWPSARSTTGSSRRRPLGWSPRASCGPHPLLASLSLMTRNEVLELIRGHLAEELEVDPSRIQDDTRFKEDLEADSLDLVALVQELEDRSGVRIPDEDAVKITTVGQAADYVASRLESEAPA